MINHYKGHQSRSFFNPSLTSQQRAYCGSGGNPRLLQNLSSFYHFSKELDQLSIIIEVHVDPECLIGGAGGRDVGLSVGAALGGHLVLTGGTLPELAGKLGVILKIHPYLV